jgi:intein-encoded DNA endonuclease-like protein
MPDGQYQSLLGTIEKLALEVRQLSLEFQEFSKGINDKFEIVSKSLDSCRSHCYVANPIPAETT